MGWKFFQIAVAFVAGSLCIYWAQRTHYDLNPVIIGAVCYLASFGATALLARILYGPFPKGIWRDVLHGRTSDE